MTPYARHMALCVILWEDQETGEGKRTPPFSRYDLKSRMELIRSFGKPLYLIRCHEWRRRPSASEAIRRENRTARVD